ncbi:MAG TPA: sugar ABC transporter permease [Candidatus Nanopelagicaceae bacterium]|nr:sugar ABC transporter permease [Candidatus Nanopelagicaceae bacterium]
MSFRLRLMAPLMALFVASVGYPLLYAFYLSLTSYRITHRWDTHLVGLSQYNDVLHNADYWSALKVTGTFVAVAVTIELCVGLMIALALQRQKWIRDFTRSFLLTPMFVTPIAVGLMFRFLLNQQLGALPAVLGHLGIVYDFFGNNNALFSIIMIDTWQWTPFMVLLLLAGLESLPKQPFEAARVDGASTFYTFRRVTVPMLTPVLVVAILIRSLDAMKVFEYVFAITRGGPGTQTQTIQYFTYQTGIEFYRLGNASAMSYLLLAIVLAVVIFLFKRVERAKQS